MPRQPHRRFLISDGMILIAATAIGIALTRAILPELDKLRTGSPPGLRSYFLVQYALTVVIPTLSALTLALLLLRLKKPRPRLRRVFLQPGAAACAVATCVMTLETILQLALRAVGSRAMPFQFTFMGYAGPASFAILGGWLSLALTVRWRPEPSWLDRAGRAAGATWLVITAIEWSSYFLI
jgi:hypothetical protein